MVGDEDREEIDGLRLAAVSYSFPECQAVASMLRANGIPSRVHPWLAATVHPTWMVAIGGLHILVPAMHLADARALLQAAEPWEPELTAGWSKFNLLDTLVTILLFVLIGFVPPPRICLDFGQRGRAAYAGGPQSKA